MMINSSNSIQNSVQSQSVPMEDPFSNPLFQLVGLGLTALQYVSGALASLDRRFPFSLAQDNSLSQDQETGKTCILNLSGKQSITQDPLIYITHVNAETIAASTNSRILPKSAAVKGNIMTENGDNLIEPVTTLNTNMKPILVASSSTLTLSPGSRVDVHLKGSCEFTDGTTMIAEKGKHEAFKDY